MDKDDNENLATVVIALMQKDSRLKRKQKRSADSQEEFIQFRFFKVFFSNKFNFCSSNFKIY